MSGFGTAAHAWAATTPVVQEHGAATGPVPGQTPTAAPPRHLGYALAEVPGPPLAARGKNPPGIRAAIHGLLPEVLPELVPVLSVEDARATEGEVLVFVVTLDQAASGTVTVSYATSDGTATAGEDYEAASGTLEFAAGETEKTVEVAVLDDEHYEGDETLALALSDASGAAIGDGNAAGTVRGGICARTRAVRHAIVARIRTARNCGQVTAAHLAKLRGTLRLDDKGIGSLKAGDFAGLAKLTEIWLDNNLLTSLPSDLFDGLSALEILQLGGNRLETLQSDVFDPLPELWFLDLSNNRLSSLSAGAFNGLPALEQLVLGANRSSTLPEGVFGGLPELLFLDLEDLRLSALPAGVFDGLSALEELNLEANRLSELPAEVFDGLSSLTDLTLMANQLSSLPAEVFDGLSSLTKLHLDRNRLSSLPAEVFDGLSSLTELTLMANQLSSLPEDLFDGLSSLYWISLPSNRLSTLPDGVFEGLSALRMLEVQDNPVDPMVLAVSLAKVGDNGFKATVPAGAAFTMTLPVSIENGSIDGGATTLRIPVGAVESGTVTVTRTAGTTAAVTADIGPSLPAPPARNTGYELAGAPGLPLEVLPELPPALSVADARATEGVDGTLVFEVKLDRSASGEVTVSYATSDGTAAAGEDYEAASGTLEFAAGETEKTVEVAVLDETDAEGEETLALALSDASGARIADGEATGKVTSGICARTEAVRDAIVARIEAARDCAQVTAARLAGLEGELRLDDRGISVLKAGDFAGLSALELLELGGNQLDTLRSDVFDGLPKLWFLDLSNNRLSSLSAGAFNGLPALEHLVLGANRLSTLPEGVFGGLPELWFLDLEDLRLSALPAGVFDGLSALEELNLEANRLSELPAKVFDGLSSLTDLTLMANQLSSLPAEVFDGLSSLTTLRLDQNRLSSLPPDLFAGLSSLEQLFLHTNRLTSAGLPPGVFDGLSSLFRLNLRTNRLTTLPDGLFGGLSALTVLELYGNSVDTMVVTVSLAKVGTNGFKATVPAGAPFAMTLPVSVANGSIDGGATKLTIPVGAVESGTLTVTRAAGTTAAVTADIGMPLPAPPKLHLGYALARAAGLPLEVLPEAPPLTARFEDMPESHDGEKAFTFGLTFSEEFPISYKTLRDHAFDVTGGAVRKARRKQRGSNLRWIIKVRPDSSAAVRIELPETTDCDARGAICTRDDRPLSHSLSATVVGPTADHVDNDGAGWPCPAPGIGEEATRASLVAALWEDGDPKSARLVTLDNLGNGNGRYDLGDLLAWIARCRRGEGCCGGPASAVGAEPPRTSPALPSSRRPAKASRRRRRVRGSGRHRPSVPGDRGGGGSATRWLRAALLAAVAAAWGCGIGDAIVGAQGDEGSTAAVDSGPLQVRLASPPQVRDIGAMLVIQGPAIDSLQAPGLELIETAESSSTRREVVITGAMSDGPILQVWVPRRADHAQYRVILLQIAGDDFTLGDPAMYRTAISR